MTSCGEDEKDIVIIDGNLPIKTSTLYMVGDATPNGWSIDDPTPLTPTEDDPLVFAWEGGLNAGEMKLCLTTGSWDAGFIRPEANGEEIGKTAITSKPFVMWAGDPDNKWKVAEAGLYKLTFDLRNWTISTEYLGEKPKDPIDAECIYLIGGATPGGWAWSDAIKVEPDAGNKYLFTWTGELKADELKVGIEYDNFDAPFIRPSSPDVAISSVGVAAPDFIYTAGPDDKWRVTEAGNYTLTFDLEHWTISAVKNN